MRKEEKNANENVPDIDEKIKGYIDDKLIALENQLSEIHENIINTSKTPEIKQGKNINNNKEMRDSNPLNLDHNELISINLDQPPKSEIINNNINNDFVNISIEHVNKPNNRKFDDICSICSGIIFYEKYICCICSGCTICTQCEKYHRYHPLLKINCQNISSMDEIYSFLSSHQMKSKNPSSNLLDIFQFGSIDFKIELFSNYCTMRVNQVLKIPVKIKNCSDKQLNKKIGFYLIAKNSKDLKIETVKIRDGFNKREEKEYELTVSSNESCKLYDFKIELFCADESIKLSCNTLNMKIEVNEDQEEDAINMKFANYNKIIIQSKHHKEILMHLMNEIERENANVGDIVKDLNPIVVLECLKDSDWNFDEAKSALAHNIQIENQLNQLNL